MSNKDLFYQKAIDAKDKKISELKEQLKMFELETFQEWCSRVKEEACNAPWEDMTVESLYKAYKHEKTGLT